MPFQLPLDVDGVFVLLIAVPLLLPNLGSVVGVGYFPDTFDQTKTNSFLKSAEMLVAHGSLAARSGALRATKATTAAASIKKTSLPGASMLHAQSSCPPSYCLFHSILHSIYITELFMHLLTNPIGKRIISQTAASATGTAKATAKSRGAYRGNMRQNIVLIDAVRTPFLMSNTEYTSILFLSGVVLLIFLTTRSHL